MWVIRGINLKELRNFVLKNSDMEPDEVAAHYGITCKALTNYTRSAGLARFRVGKFRSAYRSYVKGIRDISIDLPLDRRPEELVIELISRGYNDVEIALKLNIFVYEVSYTRRMHGKRPPQSRKDSFCDGEGADREEYIRDPLPEKDDKCCSRVCEHLRPLIESLGKYLKHHPE